MAQIEIIIASDLDSTDVRSDLHAELECCGEMIAEVYQIKNRLLVELHTTKHEIEFADLIEALNIAKERIYLTPVEACYLTMLKIHGAVQNTIDDGKKVRSIYDIVDAFKSMNSEDDMRCPEGAEYIVNQHSVTCPIHGDMRNIYKLLEEEKSGLIQKCKEALADFNL